MENKNDVFGNSCISNDETYISYISLSKPKNEKRKVKINFKFGIINITHISGQMNGT